MRCHTLYHNTLLFLMHEYCIYNNLYNSYIVVTEFITRLGYKSHRDACSQCAPLKQCISIIFHFWDEDEGKGERGKRERERERRGEGERERRV